MNSSRKKFGCDKEKYSEEGSMSLQTCSLKDGKELIPLFTLQIFASFVLALGISGEQHGCDLCPLNTNKRIGIPPFFALCFIVCFRYCVFYKLKVHGNPASSKSFSTIFSSSFSSLHVSVSHLVALTIFQTLHQQNDYDSLKPQMAVSIFQQ